MKKTLIALILCAVSSVSCSKQPAAAPVVPAASAPASAPSKQPEQKRVCIKVWDAKTAKEVEKCRIMKVREKYEGTKVPPK